MEKFNRTLRGYDPEEVNAFLDKVIVQVEAMIKDSKDKDAKLASLSQLQAENEELKRKLEQYERMEQSLNSTIILAQKTADQVRVAAQRESDIIVTDAKKNANRIVNEALMDADKTEREAEMLRHNITVFKRRLRDIISNQLEVVDDIEKVEF